MAIWRMESHLTDPNQHDLPVTFTSFVVSLAGSAMMHLGEAPHPGTGKTQTDLALAKSTIDLLTLLRQKTKGNLEQEEQVLLNTLLDELNGKFTQLSA